MQIVAGMKIIRKASFTASPWKNGGGVTHEVIRVPASGEGFRWRLSVAQIDVSGPFSDFAGYARTMVLLRGAGVRLSFEAGDGVRTNRVDPVSLDVVGAMVEFDGALKTECRLLDGPCADLNLMVARSMGDVAARVERIGAPIVLPAARRGVTLVFGIEGGVAIERTIDREINGCRDGNHGSSTHLEPWDLAILPSGGGGMVLSPDPRPGSSSLVFLASLDDTSG